jgi:hypothetical protein
MVNGTGMLRNARIFDNATNMKDAGLVAASAAATVSAVAKILDLGTGLMEGQVIVDIAAIEVATGDESYRIEVQLSNSSSFASGIVHSAILHVGDSTVTFESADSAIGRYIVPVRNAKNGVLYRYMRIYTRVAGTVATGVNYEAFFTKHG